MWDNGGGKTKKKRKTQFLNKQANCSEHIVAKKKGVSGEDVQTGWTGHIPELAEARVLVR